VTIGKLWIAVIASLLALTSCAQSEIAPLPTLAPSATPIVVTALPTATPIVRPTLPPTWTPVLDTSPASDLPAATPTAERMPAVQFVPATPLAVCAAFGEDRERNSRTFVPGTEPQVFWTAVDGATSYYIALIDDTGTIVFEGYTADPTIVFPAELFAPGRLYGWEVFPIDALGQQMCLARGAELFPEGLPGRQ